MKTEVCNWLKKLDESKIHFNLQRVKYHPDEGLNK